MKRIQRIIVSCLLLSSCSMGYPSLPPYIHIYKSDWIGEMEPDMIFIWTRDSNQQYEYYDPTTQSSIYGQWHKDKDTLFLEPEYESCLRRDSLRFNSISQQDSSVTSITQKFLIRKDYLIDITDFNVMWGDNPIYDMFRVNSPDSMLFINVQTKFRSRKSACWLNNKQ